MAKGSPKSGSKKGSPDKKSKDSPKKGKDSPKKSKDSPKKGTKEDEPKEEEVITLTLPKGVMHEVLRNIYDQPILPDVNFVVGPEGETKTFNVNRCILVAESPVFQKLMKDIEEWKTAKLKRENAEAWEKVKEGRTVPPDPEDENLSEEEEIIPPEIGIGCKKGSPKKEKSGKSKSPDKKSKDSKKGSPDKKSKDSKKGSPDKKSKDSKKGSPDKKSKDSKKGSPKGSPKGKKASPDKVDKEEVEPVNILEDKVIDESTIRVQDVHPDGFYRLMRYIYYDEIVFNGVIGTIRTLYAARKYLFYDLARACVLYLENNITLRHVLRLLKASLQFHEDNLRNLCMDLIINKTFEVISQPAFIHITKEMITLILEQDTLNIREIELFDRVSAWAENRCEDIGIAVNSVNQRIVLGSYTFSLIRFPTILPHEFASHIVENGILRNDELIGIMSYHITGKKPNVPYSFVTRRRPYKEPYPDYEALSMVYSNATDITFVDIHRDYRMRYSISMDDLDPPKRDLTAKYDPCDDFKPKKTIAQTTDYPLVINNTLYRTTSLPTILKAYHYELQLIHFKMHPDSCRNFQRQPWYLDDQTKDITLLRPRIEQSTNKLRHWEFETQLTYDTLCHKYHRNQAINFNNEI